MKTIPGRSSGRFVDDSSALPRWRASRLLGVAATILVLVVAAIEMHSVAPAWGQTPGPCHRATLPGGALSLTCVPAQGWNGDLVLFAHGYVSPGEPLGFPDLALATGESVPLAVQSAGYAFATTSYRRNGLAVLEGVQDLRELRAAFTAAVGPPGRVFAIGVSEGGLVVTLLAERHPDEASGALATCAPIGSFRAQIDHIGDFRVLFDYFFPRVLTGSPIAVPRRLRARWATVYRPRIEAAVTRNSRAARQLLRAVRAPGHGDLRTTTQTIVNSLRYGVFATNDARVKLGGNPYDNRARRYSGSKNDRRLNRRVRRFDAHPQARRNLLAYATSGDLRVPLVSVHTTGDEVVPYRQQRAYAAKVRRAGRTGNLTSMRIPRYGHCNFSAAEMLAAFTTLVNR